MIFITTVVANFTVDKVSRVMNITNQVAWAQRHALRHPDQRIEVFNAAGVLVLGAGPKGIVPEVWSHTPFIYGMPAESIQLHFEDRATSVLGDVDNIPKMTKFQPDAEGHGYKDYRYVNEYVRAAWMMYVELTIEHFNTKV